MDSAGIEAVSHILPGPGVIFAGCSLVSWFLGNLVFKHCDDYDQ